LKRNWLIHKSGLVLGPFESEHLKAMAQQGLLLPEDLVSKDGSTFCKKAIEIKGLFALPSELNYKPNCEDLATIKSTKAHIQNEVEEESPENLHLFSYLWRHWEATHGSLLLPVLIAILLIPCLSMAKPLIGYQGLFDIAEVTITFGIIAFSFYLISQTASFFLGGKRSVSDETISVLSLAAFTFFVLGIVFLAPLAVVESYLPLRGALVKVLPYTGRIQKDLGFDEPWPNLRKDNKLVEDELSLDGLEADQEKDYGFRGFSWIISSLNSILNHKYSGGFGDDWELVEAQGVGNTPQLAIRDAFRRAVEQVVGTLVDSEVVVQNDKLINEKILTASNGFIERYEEIPDSAIFKNGLHHIGIRAEVKKRNVIRRLKSVNITVNEINGKAMFEKIVSKMEAKKASLALFENQFKSFPEKMIKAAQVGDLKESDINAETAKLGITIRIEPDLKEYSRFENQLKQNLSKLSISEGEFSIDLEKVDKNNKNLNNMTRRFINNSMLNRNMRQWIPILYNKNLELIEGKFVLAIASSNFKTPERFDFKYFELDDEYFSIAENFLKKDGSVIVSLEDGKHEKIHEKKASLSVDDDQRKYSPLVVTLSEWPSIVWIAPVFFETDSYLPDLAKEEISNSFKTIVSSRNHSINQSFNLSFDELQQVESVKVEIQYND
jgi:hypothetical protein